MPNLLQASSAHFPELLSADKVRESWKAAQGVGRGAVPWHHGDGSRCTERPPSQVCPSIRSSPGCRQAALLITGFNNSFCWKLACKEQINSGRQLQKAVLPHSVPRANLQRESCWRKACRIRACNDVLAHKHAHMHSHEIFTFISGEGKIIPFLGVVTLLFGKQGGRERRCLG